MGPIQLSIGPILLSMVPIQAWIPQRLVKRRDSVSGPVKNARFFLFGKAHVAKRAGFNGEAKKKMLQKAAAALVKMQFPSIDKASLIASFR